MRALHGGCDFPVDPERDLPAAPVFWDPTAAPAVVTLLVSLPEVGLSSLSQRDLPVLARVETAEATWLRLDNGAQIVAGNLLPDVQVGIVLPLDSDWPARIAAAERLYDQLTGRPVDLRLTKQRRERLKRALRTVDGLHHGASYRGIAVAFFGDRRVSDEPWKTNALKYQIARLAAYGRRMVDRGYRELLRGKFR